MALLSRDVARRKNHGRQPSCEAFCRGVGNGQNGDASQGTVKGTHSEDGGQDFPFHPQPGQKKVRSLMMRLAIAEVVFADVIDEFPRFVENVARRRP